MSTIGRFQFLAFVALGMLVASSASAQRGGRLSGVDQMYVVRLAGIEAVQKELGVNAEVAAKLTALNEECIAAMQKAYQDAGIDVGNFQGMSAQERQKLTAINTKVQVEFSPKVKALVSADQFKRLTGIQLQADLRNRGMPVLNNPAVAAELKLTDEQKKKLADLEPDFGAKLRVLFTTGGGSPEAVAKVRDEFTAKALEVLTVEQKTALEKLKGKEFDVSQLGLGGRGRGRRGGAQGN